MPEEMKAWFHKEWASRRKNNLMKQQKHQALPNESLPLWDSPRIEKPVGCTPVGAGPPLSSDEDDDEDPFRDDTYSGFPRRRK